MWQRPSRSCCRWERNSTRRSRSTDTVSSPRPWSTRSVTSSVSCTTRTTWTSWPRVGPPVSRSGSRVSEHMATTTEVERKYDVPVDFALPDLSGLRPVAAVDQPVELRLDATYYDTPGLRLAAHQVTVRRRSGGHDAGWHVKRPTGPGERTESQSPLGDSGGEVPPAIATQVRALSRGEPLAPVVRIRTRRTERPLRDAEGTVLALVAEDVVSSEALGDPALGDPALGDPALGDPAVEQHWREVEGELLDR